MFLATPILMLLNQRLIGSALSVANFLAQAFVILLHVTVSNLIYGTPNNRSRCYKCDWLFCCFS